LASLLSPSELCTARWPIAAGHYWHCLLCEHRCGVDRSAGEHGPCHAGVEARAFRHRVEYGEELELIPSHLFYLSGCDLRCAFCIAEANAFDPSRGSLLTPEFFAETVAWGRRQGARNVQWVGGEPTIHLPEILRAMAVVSEMQTGKKFQMPIMDAALLDLYQRGDISYDVALSNARDPDFIRTRSGHA
jgi:uncharacterized Fe-S radical SAM superfamily protein PflX